MRPLSICAHFFNNVSKCFPCNPFPHDKILDQTKLKAFASDKLKVTKMIISVFDRVENMVGKGEIVQEISPFPQCFQKASLLDPSNGVIVLEWVKAAKNRECYWKY